MVTQRLLDLPQLPTGDVGELRSVQARLDAPAEQIGTGLRATFSLENGGAEPVALVNPVDLLQWQLLDEAGNPLAVPSRPSNLRVHRPASAPWKLNSAVPIVEVSRAGELADAAVLDSPTVALAALEELSITFEFGHVLDAAAAVELPSGDYRLACTATLIEATTANRARILRCDPLIIRFVRA